MIPRVRTILEFLNPPKESLMPEPLDLGLADFSPFFLKVFCLGELLGIDAVQFQI